MRYHPAIVAQAAATLAIISDDRFTLGIGAGERLNEHVVGQGFPSVRGRHERLADALEIINLLWRGGYQSYEGKYLQLEDARIFDLPDRLPVLAVAAGGQDAAELAAVHGTGCSPPNRARTSSTRTPAAVATGRATRRCRSRGRRPRKPPSRPRTGPPDGR